MLFDIDNDPYEKEDIAEKHPDVVAEMHSAYVKWFKEMAVARAFQPPRIALGAKEENPVVLTRQDWRGPKAGWKPRDQGHWLVNVVEATRFDVTVHVPEDVKAGVVHFRYGDQFLGKRLEAGATSVKFANVALPEGNGRVEAWIGEPGNTRGVRYVEVRRRD